jgi:hypothetical protein
MFADSAVHTYGMPIKMACAPVSPGNRPVAEPEQVSRGQELLSILRCSPLPSASCAVACDTEEDVKVILKHGLITLVSPSAKRMTRAMSDSALLHRASDSDPTYVGKPLVSKPELSDASTEVSDDQQESHPEEVDVTPDGLALERVRTDTCWSDNQDMDMYNPYLNYMNMDMQAWWMPTDVDGNPDWAAMPADGTFMYPQQWAEQTEECNVVDVAGAGEEWRTTVMLRNMPNNYTRDMLLDLVDSMGFSACYDFAYLPVDFKSQAGLGYAFINFSSSAEAQRCFDEFEGFSEWKVPSEKVCTVTWGNPYQGLEAHVERYQNSPVMHHSIPDEWKPVLFDQGARISFPPPTKAIKTPKVRQAPAEIAFQ